VIAQQNALPRNSTRRRQWFRVSAVSLRSGDGHPLGYVLVFHDVTELKRLETVRVDFVANVSHELRTPISAIKGYVKLCFNPPQSHETAQQFLEVIDRHSERLGRLVGDLLTLSVWNRKSSRDRWEG
jgi:two-component system phosphate regulon sensor histidine kinase PhoR